MNIFVLNIFKYFQNIFSVLKKRIINICHIHMLIKAYDMGASMFVHVFGAFFGLAVAKMINHRYLENNNESSTYNSVIYLYLIGVNI